MNNTSFACGVSYRYLTELSFQQALTQSVDRYLNVSGKIAVVIPGAMRNGSQETIIVPHTPPSIETALKISSYILTAGILPISMLLLKCRLRFLNKFHMTNMSDSESCERLTDLERQKSEREALTRHCKRLSDRIVYSTNNHSNFVFTLLQVMNPSERDHFVTLGIRACDKIGADNESNCRHFLEYLTQIPHLEREVYTNQCLRLSQIARQPQSHNWFHIILLVPHAERKEFVAQASRLLTLGDLDTLPKALKALRRAPSEEREGRLTRAMAQMQLEFPHALSNTSQVHFIDLELYCQCFDRRFAHLLTTPLRTPLEPLDTTTYPYLSQLIGVTPTLHPATVGLNNIRIDDNAYQVRLQLLVTDAVNTIYRNPSFAKLFCDDQTAPDPIKAGQAAIDESQAAIYIPLANYAQFLELQGDITCPDQFNSARLRDYNTRRSSLISAKIELQKLSLSETSILINKLLNSSTNIEGMTAIKSLYRQIGALSGSLHQGMLMRQIRSEVGGEIVVTDLFRKAITKAAQERS